MNERNKIDWWLKGNLKYANKCDKVSFLSVELAEKFIKKKNLICGKKNTHKTMGAVYKCEKCGLYHTTSMSKKRSRILNQMKRKGWPPKNDS